MAKRLGERLIEAGLVSAEAVEQALAHQRISGHRLGDCLVELGLVAEAGMLRFLATEFKTRFVSAEKLSRAAIPTEVLDRVPVRTAEAHDFLPIAVDRDRRILSIVMAEPQNEELLKEIAHTTDMAEVVAFVGVRSAIQAGIRRHYYGDPTAFAAIEAGGGAGALRNPGDASRPASAWEGAESRPSEAPSRSGRSGPAAGRDSSRGNPAQLGSARGTVGEGDFVETLNVLVGLLELPAREFRGHSGLVARQASLIARRIGLQPREVAHTSMAGYLHDLGKRSDRHLTLPLLATQPELRAEARRSVRAPIKLFETVNLPAGVNAVLAQLYEAFDGSGLPLGVKGEEIAPGARIIAAVDAFFDLTRNPANAFARLLPKQEALDYLHQQGGALFDPVVVDTLTTLLSGELLRQRMGNDGRQVLVADPDEAVRTDLMDALGKAGMVVQSVLKLDGVIDAVLANEADTISVGLAYGVAELVAMTQFVRLRPESAAVPVLVVGDPTDPASRERLVQAGVTGFVSSGAAPEDAAALIRGAYLDRVEHGGVGHPVRGGFDELQPADLARLLGGDRKSGRLLVRNGALEGFAQLERGRVVFASSADKKGDAALEQLFAMPQADFTWDPEAVLMDMPNADRDLEVLARTLR